MRNWKDLRFEIGTAIVGIVVGAFTVYLYFTTPLKHWAVFFGTAGFGMALVCLVAIYEGRRNPKKEEGER